MGPRIADLKSWYSLSNCVSRKYYFFFSFFFFGGDTMFININIVLGSVYSRDPQLQALSDIYEVAHRCLDYRLWRFAMQGDLGSGLAWPFIRGG